MQTILLRVYNNFDSLKQCVGGRGALSRTSEVTGERTSYCCVLVGLSLGCNNLGYSNKSFWRLCGEPTVLRVDFSSLAKRYKVANKRLYKNHNICERYLLINVCLLRRTGFVSSHLTKTTFRVLYEAEFLLVQEACLHCQSIGMHVCCIVIACTCKMAKLFSFF